MVLPPSGKLSVNDWIDFQTRFTLARLEVRDASEADACRILTNRLTTIMFGWIVEREKKVNEDHPLVIVNIGPGYTKTDVNHSNLALIGHAPTEIVEDPRAREWALTMKHRTHAEALVKYHGRTLAGASGVFRVQRLPKTMHTDDVFKFIREKLECRARMDEHLSNREPGFGGKAVRALRREQYQSDEKTEYLIEDLQIAAVGKGASDSRKTEKSARSVAEKPKSPPRERSGKG